ncbi:MAG: hypothetical protein ACPLPW_08935, partial [bacterium]
MDQKKENKPAAFAYIGTLLIVALVAYFTYQCVGSPAGSGSTTENSLNQIRAEAFVKSQSYVSSFL